MKMRYRQTDRTLACIGAVIGAGFASGREIMVFFSQYGKWSWVLILLATGTMSMICAMMMRKMRECSSDKWCELYQGQSMPIRWLGEGCLFVLMAATGGSMLSASGELIALMLPVHGAYTIGLIGTLLIAWVMAQRSVKPLATLSGVLMIGILASYLIMMVMEEPTTDLVIIEREINFSLLAKAGISAVGYGCMNIAVSLGVVFECSHTTSRRVFRTSILFGLVLTSLLLICNYLLLQHSELQDAAFPIVQLLSKTGRTGFYLSAGILYLAVLTTCIAVLCTLQNMVFSHVKNKLAAHGITLLIPLLVSLIGFKQIVADVYAPLGIACLLFVYCPVFIQHFKKRRRGARAL